MEAIIIQIQNELKKKLDTDRYQHTVGVAYTAASLAMKHDLDINKAMIAGFLHDCAKCIPSEKKIKLCEKYNIRMTDVEKRNPFLLHAKLGAFLAAKKYNINDSEILSAILNHTTGKPDMSDLDKIIFISDYIEPGRDARSLINIKEIRQIAFEDLSKTVALVLRDTLTYLNNCGGEIDMITQTAYDYYKEYL